MKIRYKLDPMERNGMLLSITGIIPSETVKSRRWNLGMYRACQVASYVLYIPVLLLQLLALYFYWGDIDVTTDNICITCTLLTGYVPALYQMTNPQIFRKITHYINTETHLSANKMAETNPVFADMILKGKILANKIISLTLASFYVTGIMWTSFPLVLHYFDNTSDKAESSKEQLKYLVFVMWVPFDMADAFWYRLVYLVQVVTFMTAISYITALLSFFLTVMIYLETQFRIAAEAFRQIEKTARNGWQAPDNFKVTPGTSEEVLTDVVDMCTRKYGDEPACEDDKKKEIDIFRSSLLQANDEEHEFAKIVNCIKLHQSTLKFSREANNVLSIGISIPMALNVSLIITETFQLSLALTTKYGSGFFTSVTQQFIFCWFGQRIINQSLEVSEAIYDAEWYRRSSRLQRLLVPVLARAQIPVTISLGKMFPLSLQLFSQVMNICYKFFALLLQVHDNGEE